MIPYGRQEVTQEDIDAVVEVLRSDFLTQGPVVPRFEQAVAEYCGARHAVAANSATSALHLACLALGLGKGDWLWTSPITFVASANCGLYCGANVDFVDIDPATFNLSPEALEEKLREAERQGRLPKIVVAVHFGGLPCDMEAIAELGKKYGFHVIEDASHAIGAKYQGIPIGRCQFSAITVFSFHPVKIITSAEGGVATTNNTELAVRMARLRSHGITRACEEMTSTPDGDWYYQQIELGFNFRMSDVHAALGFSQLARLEEYVERRRALAKWYSGRLSDLPVIGQAQPEPSESSFHLYVIRLQAGRASTSRREVFDTMRGEGIGVNVHYIPVHLQPYYRAAGFGPGNYPEAERYYEQAITLPLYPTMTEEDQSQVVGALSAALRQ